MEIALLIGGLLIGAVIAWLFVKQQSTGKIATLENELQNSDIRIAGLSEEIKQLDGELKTIRQERNGFEKQQIESEVRLQAKERELTSEREASKAVQELLSEKVKAFDEVNNELATAKANLVSLTEKLDTQKQEMEKLNEKFSMEFENIANRILDEKTEKFTTTNKNNLESILKPLGENLDKFKTKVEEVYDKESKERFSLGEKVKELAELNQVISEEAKNLTKALKGESKTQGR